MSHKDFPSDRKQCEILNGQFSSWMDVRAGVPQCSILGPLLLLIYMNDLPGNLTSNSKLITDDTSLFSTVTDPNATANQINYDQHNNTWAHQWKMNFDPKHNRSYLAVK